MTARVETLDYWRERCNWRIAVEFLLDLLFASVLQAASPRDAVSDRRQDMETR